MRNRPIVWEILIPVTMVILFWALAVFVVIYH